LAARQRDKYLYKISYKKERQKDGELAQKGERARMRVKEKALRDKAQIAFLASGGARGAFARNG
jgi:hypothetical protein